MAKNSDFIALLDKDCRLINTTKTGWSIGEWSFEGPDSKGKVIVHCRGFLKQNNITLWFDLGSDDSKTDTLYVKQ